MKTFKRALAVILAFVLVLTVVPSVSQKDVKAAETFKITTPTANQLVAAGYIDIEWTVATTGTVKNYQIYIDNRVVGTTTETSFEYYTTKVQAFDLYVLANYTDGWSERTSTITFGVSKKGLGLAEDMGANLDLKDMGVAWYYNWGTGPSSGEQYEGIEYVPMVWKETNAYNFRSTVNRFKNQGYKYVLTFNEPDLQGQCDMPVNDVYNVWKGIKDMEGIKISSPVTALWPKASPDWFQAFMTKVDENGDYKPDFISVHCYPDNFGGAGMAKWFLEEIVDWTWETYGLPIWVTEFSTTGGAITATGDNGTKEFWEAVMPGLDEREYVERYAAFGFDSNTTGLWRYSTGKLTPGGEVYSQLGNPADFSADYPGTEEEVVDPENLGYTVEMGVKNNLLPDTVTVKEVICEDYTKNRGVSVTASSGKNSAKNIIDENIGSRWESDHGVDPQSVTIDLGNIENIKQVNIIWETASARKYTIEVSDNGIDYTVAATITKGTGTQNRNDTVVFKQMVSGRYVKIHGTSRTTQYGYSIWDMAIYGTDDTNVNDETTAAPETSTPEESTPEIVTPPITSDTSDDNLLNKVNWNVATDAEKVNCDGTITETDGIITGSFVTTGGGWNEAIDGIKAEAKNVAVEVRKEYLYSADIFATQDMTIRVIITNGEENVVAKEIVNLSAGEVYTYAKLFSTTSDKVDISYALCAGNEGAVENVEFSIYKNNLVLLGDAPNLEDETSSKVTESTSANNVKKVTKPKRTKVKKATKKKASKKVKLSIKKVKGARGYRVQFSKTKKFKKILVSKIVKKRNVTIKNKKLKNKKKLYVRVKAYKLNGKKKVWAKKWSKVKRVRINKK